MTGAKGQELLRSCLPTLLSSRSGCGHRGGPSSEVLQMDPSMFYRWQKTFFENGPATFQSESSDYFQHNPEL